MTESPEGETTPPAEPEPTRWPGAEHAAAADLLTAVCPGCRQVWLVHRDLGGFQITCRCGHGTAVPAAAVARAPSLASVRPRFPSRFLRRRQVHHQDVDMPALDNAAQAAQNNRSIVEVILILCALIGPHVIVLCAFGSRSAAIALPFTSLAGGGLVILLGLSNATHAFGALARTKSRHFVEALALAVVCAGLAYGYVNAFSGVFRDANDIIGDVREQYGLAVTMLTFALCPAVFEEIAFRGMLQGRLSAAFGDFLALAVTSGTFAVAHGVTAGLPFHFGLGLLLGWMRIRSRSLLPGMVLHGVYNALVCNF